jgi:hypothetical protein
MSTLNSSLYTTSDLLDAALLELHGLAPVRRYRDRSGRLALDFEQTPLLTAVLDGIRYGTITVNYRSLALMYRDQKYRMRLQAIQAGASTPETTVTLEVQ